ncbi:MAG: GTP cyclohydrolase I FolE [Thermoguttaceae bacterium]|nr:GTP cyclohydrolase I FolE [Thermoguttaceae bacterium]
MIHENDSDDSFHALESANFEEVEKENAGIAEYVPDASAIAEPVIRPTVDRPRIERAVREILAAVGEDPDREGLLETPKRVAKMYEELLHGLQEDPRIHLRKFFTEQYDEIVLVRDISFSSMCEHHLLPFFGKAHVAYLPKGRIIGLSKLARLVDSVARRPQVQERMTEQIANLLIQELDVLGVAVIIEAEHTCMTIRGIRRPGSRCVTSAVKGRFRSDARSRAEVMALIYSGQTPVK